MKYKCTMTTSLSLGKAPNDLNGQCAFRCHFCCHSLNFLRARAKNDMFSLLPFVFFCHFSDELETLGANHLIGTQMLKGMPTIHLHKCPAFRAPLGPCFSAFVNPGFFCE